MLTASAALGASVNPDLAQAFTEKQAATGQIFRGSPWKKRGSQRPVTLATR